MKNPLRCLCHWGIAGLFFAMVLANQANGTTWYVDKDAPTSGQTGFQPEHPFVTIQQAVAAATANANPPDVIVVGGGTTAKVYKPANSSSSINLKSGVRIEGGYLGWSGSTFDTTRDPDTYITVLSGDFGGGDRSDHVVVALSGCLPPSSGSVAERVNLDGVTVSGGFAELEGGGIYIEPNSNTQPIIRKCIITGNHADSAGGGMYADTSSQPVFRECTFTNNTAFLTGGAGSNRHSAVVTFINCTFDSNTSESSAGAYGTTRSGSVRFIGCILSNNSAPYSAGAIELVTSSASTLLLRQCKLVGNSVTIDGGGGAIRVHNTVTATIANCTVSDNSVPNDADDKGGGLLMHTGSSVTILNSIFWNNTGGTGPDIHNDGGSISVSHSNIDGGWTGSGNIGGSASDEPIFDSEYRLECGSEGIDDGSNSHVLSDSFDMDSDGVTDGTGGAGTEDEFALGVETRKVGIVDMGAYEKQLPQLTCPANIVETGNNCVGVPDLLAVINQWDTCPAPCTPACPGACTADLVHDCDVNTADLLVLINAWGHCLGGSCEGQPSSPSEVIDCMEICAEEEDYSGCVQKCLCGIGFLTEECD